MKQVLITIKYTKISHIGTQVIDDRDYYKVKARLEKLGYKVEKL
jgi:tetrahydromethanopterin S-methyltransferase subunit G